MTGESMVVLMVEDDLAHAEILRRNMEKSWIAARIVHVSNGQEALDYLYRQGAWNNPENSPRPGLILLDLRMPKVSGLEVLKTIKLDKDLACIPVVILTTSTAEADIAHAYAFHANSYLVKPMNFEGFADLINVFGYYWLVWNQYPRRTEKGLAYDRTS